MPNPWAGAPNIERMNADDRLTAEELNELAELQHCARYYGMNMTRSSLARLNLLSVMAQRDQLYDRLVERQTAQCGYSTIQLLGDTAPGAPHRIHLAGPGVHGGTGKILCGIDRHARDPETRKGLYGFSVGGGYSDPEATACPECLTKATPHISGMFAHLFKASP